tara:strand:- start:118 stop:579 length:462 start_codon:yes stop_codon:yes gene_type:complete
MGFLMSGAVGSAEQQAHEYNAKLKERNAKALEIDAEAQIFGAEWEITDFREDFQDLNKATSQAFRSNGWIAEGGTPYLVAIANAAEADEEISMRRWQALSGAQATRERGVNERLGADLERMYGTIARTRAKQQKYQGMFDTLKTAGSIAMMAK